MKTLLNIGLWVVSLACFAYAIYHWLWGERTQGDFAVTAALIVVGVICILAWFMMKRKEGEEEISITR